MIEELIKSYGAAVDSKMHQLAGINIQRKMMENQEYALQQQVSTQVDSMLQLFNQTNEFDQLDIQTQRSLECTVLTPGSNRDQSFTLFPINDLKTVYHQYVTGISEPTTDSENIWNSYYVDVDTALQAYQTSWISTYGISGETTNNNLRYNQFTTNLLRGLIDANVGPLIRYAYSFLKDGPLIRQLSNYIEQYYFNDVEIDQMISIVGNLETSQLKFDLTECLESMDDPKSYQQLANLIGKVSDEFGYQSALRNQFNNLKNEISANRNSTLPELISSITSLSGVDLYGSSQRMLTPCYRLLILLKTTTNPYIQNHAERLTEVILSLIHLQYRREAIYDGVMNLDISSTDSNDSLAALITRSFIETESYDWNTPVGLSLIKERIKQRVSQDPDCENLTTAVEFLEGKVPEGLINCPQFFLEPGVPVQQSIESKLKNLYPIDLEGVRTELMSNLLQISGNKSLANTVYTQLQRMGTDEDPLKHYLEEVDEYFSSLSLNVSVEDIERRIQSIFEGISSSSFNPPYKIHLSEIVEKFLNRSLSSYRRDYEMDRSHRLLLSSSGYTYFLKLKNLLRAVAQGEVSSTTESLIDFLGDFPSDQRDQVSFYLKVLTRPELGVDYEFYRTDLSDLVHDDELGLSMDDADDLISYVDTIHHGGVMLQERSRYQQAIVELLNKLPMSANTTQAFRLAHLLVGGCLGDTLVQKLRFELESMCHQSSSNSSKSLSALVYFLDHKLVGDVYSLVTDELIVSISLCVKASAVSRCLSLIYTLHEEDDSLVQGLIQAEILAHYFDNEQNTIHFDNPNPNYNPHLDWTVFSLRVWSILEAIQEPGLSEIQIASFHSEITILLEIDGLDAGLKEAIEDIYYIIRNNSYNESEVTLLRDLLLKLIPNDSLYGNLQTVEQLLSNIRTQIRSLPTEDSRSNAMSALYSIISENRVRASTTNNLYSAAVNNMAPTFRINSIAGNRITLIRVASSPSNMGGYAGYRSGKYKLFGGDKILDSIRRLRSPNSSYNKVFNSINQKINGVRMDIYSISSDIRSSLGLTKIKNSINDFTRSAQEEIQNILCLLDFLHDLIGEINGVIGDFMSGLRSSIANLNSIIQDILNELKRLFRMLANLGAVSMGVHCSCMSFNFNMNLDDLAGNLANWICCLNLSVPNPFLNIYGPFIEPKVGCPQYLLDMLNGQLNPNGTTRLAGRGFQTNQNLDGIFSSTSSVRL